MAADEYIALSHPLCYFMNMERLYSLTDKQFVLIAPILQEEKDARGRKPSISDRQALEGALYVLREGCGWRAMPEAFGHWMMIFMRYKRWVERGVWWKVLMRLQKAGALKVSVTFPGGKITRQRPHAPKHPGKSAAKRPGEPSGV